MKTKKLSRSQASIEITLVLLVLVLFFLGIARIWLWFMDDLVRRDGFFQRARRGLGNFEVTVHPLGSLPLTDSWIFNGEYPGP